MVQQSRSDEWYIINSHSIANIQLGSCNSIITQCHVTAAKGHTCDMEYGDEAVDALYALSLSKESDGS